MVDFLLLSDCCLVIVRCLDSRAGAQNAATGEPSSSRRIIRNEQAKVMAFIECKRLIPGPDSGSLRCVFQDAGEWELTFELWGI